MSTAIFTICSGNYLPQAAVFFESARRFAPLGTRLVLALIERPGHPAEQAAKHCEVDAVWTADQVGVPNWEAMAFYYDVTEFNTAVKPSIIRRLFAEGVERVVYFDPDIVVYSSLEPMMALLGPSDVLLTPHVCAPIPEDGHGPRMEDVIRAGQFNLGYLGLHRSKATEEFIEWWKRMLERKSLVQPRHALFYDQFWAAALPSLLDRVQVVRNEGWNMAYWNVSQRELRSGPEGWETRDGPLVFYHFSGFDFSDLTRLTKHTRRVSVAEDSPLWQLSLDYREAVTGARERLGPGTQAPYSFGVFTTGEPVLKEHRRHYLDLIEAGEVPAGNPFQLVSYIAGSQCLFADCRPERSRVAFRGWEWTAVPGGRTFEYRACLDCGCLHGSPIPNRRELGVFYRTAFDFGWYLERWWLKRRQAWHRWRRVRRRLSRGLRGPGRLLDIGCGHGWFAAEAASAGWQAEGLDFPSEALEYARTRLAIPTHKADLNDVVPPVGPYDAVTLWHCLEHLIDPREFLRRVREAVKPGGRLVIAVPNRRALGVDLRGVLWVWIQSAVLHIWHFPPQGLERLLRDVGWEIERVETRETWDANVLWDGLAADAFHRGVVLPLAILISRRVHRNNPAGREYLKRRIVFWLGESLRLIAFFPTWLVGPILRRVLRERGSELVIIARRPLDPREVP